MLPFVEMHRQKIGSGILALLCGNRSVKKTNLIRVELFSALYGLPESCDQKCDANPISEIIHRRKEMWARWVGK